MSEARREAIHWSEVGTSEKRAETRRRIFLDQVLNSSRDPEKVGMSF
jgi:hypothetical protein